ncbi:MAG TPA: hypothetical protein VJ910_09385 [Desulfuromonadales bacterium]|nr:hypothetical protein [Desulfuromonadales bacterium]
MANGRHVHADTPACPLGKGIVSGDIGEGDDFFATVFAGELPLPVEKVIAGLPVFTKHFPAISIIRKQKFHGLWIADDFPFEIAGHTLCLPVPGTESALCVKGKQDDRHLHDDS